MLHQQRKPKLLPQNQEMERPQRRPRNPATKLWWQAQRKRPSKKLRIPRFMMRSSRRNSMHQLLIQLNLFPWSTRITSTICTMQKWMRRPRLPMPISTQETHSRKRRRKRRRKKLHWMLLPNNLITISKLLRRNQTPSRQSTKKSKPRLSTRIWNTGFLNKIRNTKLLLSLIGENFHTSTWFLMLPNLASAWGKTTCSLIWDPCIFTSSRRVHWELLFLRKFQQVVPSSLKLDHTTKPLEQWSTRSQRPELKQLVQHLSMIQELLLLPAAPLI